jgi:hypothetical protein
VLAVEQRFVAAEPLHPIDSVHCQIVALADVTSAGHDVTKLRISVPVPVVEPLQVVYAHVEAAPIVISAKLWWKSENAISMVWLGSL